MGNKFLVGEHVVRVMDGLPGVVKEISTFQGEFSYKVDLGRDPLPGYTDDLWWGTETAWRRARTIHAHVVTRSRDCDGDYEKGHTDVLTTTERVSDFGELEFKERVMNSVVSFSAEYTSTLTITSDVMVWEQPTDEGYVHTDVTWCEQDTCDRSSYQRDYRAEAMGY